MWPLEQQLVQHGRKVERWIRPICEHAVPETAFQIFYKLLVSHDERARARTSTQASAIVEELHQNGIARIPGYLTPEQVEAYRALVIEQCDRSEAYFKQAVSTQAPRGVEYVRSEWGELDGRARTTFKRRDLQDAPLLIRRLFEESRVNSIVSAAMGVPTLPNDVLLERLVPAPEAYNSWHFDTLGAKMKAMILLTRTTKAHGPLRYKVGTHRHTKQMRTHYYMSFKHGHDFAVPSPALMNRLPGEEFGTGDAGDCIVFNTFGVHAGSRVEAGHGERLCIVLNYTPQSTRNLIMRLLGSRAWW